MPLVDYKNHKEGMPYELKFPFRPNNNSKWPRSSSSPQTRAAGTGGTLIKAPPPDFTDRNSGVIPRSVSSDGRPLNPKRSVVALGSHTHVLARLNLDVVFLQVLSGERQLRPSLLHRDGSHAAQRQLPRLPPLRRHRGLDPLEAEVHARRVSWAPL